MINKQESKKKRKINQTRENEIMQGDVKQERKDKNT